MARSAWTGFQRQLAELRDALCTIPVPGESVAQSLLPGLRQVFASDHAGAGRFAMGERTVQVERLDCSGFVDSRAYTRDLDGLLASEPRPLAFDPLQPEPQQRNRALRPEDLFRRALPTPSFRQLGPRHGFAHLDHVRLLVCDGPTLLSWVTCIRDGPFTAEECSALESLAAPLVRRLRLEDELGSARLAHGVAQAALEELGTPAFLLDGRGRIALQNQPGRRLRERGWDSLRAELVAASRGEPSPFRATRVAAPGLGPHLLVVRRGQVNGLAALLPLAGERWSLSKREAAVLHLLVEGNSNRAIAATLGCALKTVEQHVSALFDKSGTANRASLVTAVWAMGSR